MAGLMAGTSIASAAEVNLFSSRHYDTDEAIYSNFTEKTGITVNRIEDSADKLIERMQSEGELSPADVLLTVDVGRIDRAARLGLLAPMESDVVSGSVPAELIDEDGEWLGVSTRVRAIFYDKENVENPPTTYEALADPQYEGMVCTRSGSNVYMLALLQSIIAHAGEEAAKEWAMGLKNNLARDPQGGDTDQIRAVVSGECDIVVANHYYFARALRKEVSGLTGSTDMVGVVFPNQDDRGIHQNISAVAVAKNAPNAENAMKFVEYLVSPEAQKMLADGNDEFPVVADIEPSEGVQSLGDFKRDTISLADFADTTRAQEIWNEIGYQ
ncbi:MAG: extracellular solute-binding protein [Pseudomonadota bacterium]